MPITPPAAEVRASTPTPSIEQVVATDFPVYDADKSGDLNKAEFDKWIVAVKTASGATAPDAAWLTDAFAKADGDKSKSVSAAELTSFLSA